MSFFVSSRKITAGFPRLSKVCALARNYLRGFQSSVCYVLTDSLQEFLWAYFHELFRMKLSCFYIFFYRLDKKGFDRPIESHCRSSLRTIQRPPNFLNLTGGFGVFVQRIKVRLVFPRVWAAVKRGTQPHVIMLFGFMPCPFCFA